MKKVSSIIYVICFIFIFSLLLSIGMVIYNRYGKDVLVKISSLNTSSATRSDNGQQGSVQTSVSVDSGGNSQSSNGNNAGTQTSSGQQGDKSQSTGNQGGESPSSLNYEMTVYSFELVTGNNPLANYESLYTIVIPLNRFSADLPDEGYTTYIAHDGESLDDYLGDGTPLIYYEIKYEYAGAVFTKLIVIPRSVFTITGGQLFVTRALPDTIFNDTFYQSILRDGSFISIKIVSRDQYFVISDWSATHSGS